MDTQKLSKLYQELMRKDSGVRFVKFDLHIHSKASYDFACPSNYDMISSLLGILDNAISSNIEIIAITDHNTFEGYNCLMEYMRSNIHIARKYSNILVLCGIEITCFSKHLLAIFDQDFGKENQEQFLNEIGITKDTVGTKDAVADVLGPIALIDKIKLHNGIAILAHADTKEGFMYSYCKPQTPISDFEFRGKSLIKILNANGLYGIQVNNTTNRRIISDLLSRPDFLNNGKQLALLEFSDSHGIVIDGKYTASAGKEIGSAYTIAKLSHKTFESVKMTLSDPNTRIVQSFPSYEYPYIIGCAIDSDIIKEGKNAYALFRFNPELNCIIGARGTGKSTLLTTIQDVLNLNDDIKKVKRTEPLYYNNRYYKFNSVILFLSYDNLVYAIVCDPQYVRDEYVNSVNSSLNISVFVLRKTRFHKISIKANVVLKSFLSVIYDQKGLYRYFENPNLLYNIIDDFLFWKKQNNFTSIISQIKRNKTDLYNKLSGIYKNTNTTLFSQLVTEEVDLPSIVKMHHIASTQIAQLHKLRSNMVDELNELLKGRVRLKITRTFSNEDHTFLIDNLPKQFKGYYEHQINIRNLLRKVIGITINKESFCFFIDLLTKDNDYIIKEYDVGACKECNTILNELRTYMLPDELQIFMNDTISMEYNVNSGSQLKEEFRDNRRLSLGQNAVALLLLILNASYNLSDTRPLIMDQPEDDLDNSYIYSTLVNEFRNSKQKRQIIISTHNPNIPVASDAENIIILKHDGINCYMDSNGSIDNPKVAEEVLDILEGGREALDKRVSKYFS